MGVNGSAITNYDRWSDAVQTLGENNADLENLATIMAPRTRTTLDKFKATDNQPLQPPESFRSMRKLATNQVPINITKGTSVNASEVYTGDFSQCLIGVRRELIIEASREASDATDRAFSQLMVFIRAYLRADVQLAHPQHFVVLDAVIP
jgi:HK97 family phage major capsid protein